jgi:hypothetical protein
MNLFYLDRNIKKCAAYHCNKHKKMIVEYSQMLSTAHRYLDGNMIYINGKNCSKKKYWQLQDNREIHLYKATHYNHPTAKWVRQSSENYKYMYNLLVELHKEFEWRDEKEHGSKFLLPFLKNLPNNIKKGKFFDPPQAMPDEYKCDDTVQAYRNFYKYDKVRFATWKKRAIPNWMRLKNDKIC